MLVVTGVAREARIAAAPGIQTVCSGGSPKRLRGLLLGLDPAPIKAVVSFGIGGGLDPALTAGDIVVADAVVFEDERWLADGLMTKALMGAFQAAGEPKACCATILGAEAALLGAAEKSEARARTGAALVDMESHLAARYAASLGVPFAVLRVVCDPASLGLPPLVGEALNPDGSVSLAGVAGSLCRTPEQIPALLRLARESRRAFRTLARVPLARILAPVQPAGRPS